jgi:uncharacterized protein YceK
MDRTGILIAAILPLLALSGCGELVSRRQVDWIGNADQRYYPSLTSSYVEYVLFSRAVSGDRWFGYALLSPYLVIDEVVSLTFDTILLPYDACRSIEHAR